MLAAEVVEEASSHTATGSSQAEAEAETATTTTTTTTGGAHRTAGVAGVHRTGRVAGAGMTAAFGVVDAVGRMEAAAVVAACKRGSAAAAEEEGAVVKGAAKVRCCSRTCRARRMGRMAVRRVAGTMAGRGAAREGEVGMMPKAVAVGMTGKEVGVARRSAEKEEGATSTAAEVEEVVADCSLPNLETRTTTRVHWKAWAGAEAQGAFPRTQNLNSISG